MGLQIKMLPYLQGNALALSVPVRKKTRTMHFCSSFSIHHTIMKSSINATVSTSRDWSEQPIIIYGRIKGDKVWACKIGCQRFSIFKMGSCHHWLMMSTEIFVHSTIFFLNLKETFHYKTMIILFKMLNCQGFMFWCEYFLSRWSKLSIELINAPFIWLFTCYIFVSHLLIRSV